ncbi:MAG TPA: cytochrome P450 [Caulobacteraceae bacterium]|jgi:cytochrome P450
MDLTAETSPPAHGPSAHEPLVPPAPIPPKGPLPLWRFMRQLSKSTIGIWGERAYETPILAGKRFGRNTLMVNDPEGVRHVAAGDTKGLYGKSITTRRLVRPAVGDGLILAEGAQWRQQRRVLAPAFTPNTVNLFIPHFKAAAEALISDLSKGPRHNLALAFQETALDAACRALFSMPIGGRGRRLAKLARNYVKGPGRPMIWDSLAPSERFLAFLTPGRWLFRKRWLKEVRGIVAERRAQERDPDRPSDLLDLLLESRAPDSQAEMTDEEVRDQVATFITAGFETTARLLFWTLYLLSLDKAEQQRLRQEVTAFPPDRVKVLANLQKWPRLRAVLQESMRLYPPAPLFTRVAVAEDVVAGHKVEPGTLVMISPWLMHRHKTLWQRPEAFIPDRFEGKPQDYMTNGAYIPFGCGPRICIGATFALAEASVVLAMLLQRFDVDLDDDRPVMPVSVITTMPDIEPWFRLTPTPS